MVSGEGFIVSVSKVEVVAPELPMQEHWLPLSNLDLLIPPLDFSVFICYKNPSSMSFPSMVGSLKNALAQALVYYYPLAGEVVTNSTGEPELFCSNRGVDFVEAVADVELHRLNMYNPDDTIEGKLVPKKKHGVLAVQATGLKCGSLVVACALDHRIGDAYSANMFLVSWAEIAQPNKPIISAHPCFRRSLLFPRRPPSIDHPSLHDMYAPMAALPPPKFGVQSEPLISRIYYVTSDHLNRMQALASSNGVKRTRLQSFSAFLWKTVAEAAAAGVDGQRKVVAKMGVVVDGRKRLSNGDKNMGSYFGNVLSIPYGGKQVEELVEKPLSWVAEKVHEFLEMGVTEEHFLGLVDWVEAHRPVPGVARIYCGHENEEGPRFVVSSGQRFPVSKVDFGWGKPVFASYHFPWGGDAGYVMPMPSPIGNGDWLVYMHLFEGLLSFMESKDPQVFKPFSWDYVLSRH
ncbi:shikimate O-hydroxycinnamoyltransferase [Cajanus cajan]|uniref:Anthranilate N-benzoyltransferase protein 1 n=1 Tax=Cajanus cajan TaxID=3821 RepID=A0A151QW53_CAJCA|nr:shikimate O-hydroxycinnamoyltransferase [Cajanus cajan]KYP34561.1 Anthranilate N-benzoyltransferase protein 1 [Cajanus cajan]